ncbi:hypothetical protein K2173_000919 [Erythroxylum novogranatense]|uniref:NB-ARC domain-containing protein n=1 Tax=Erythroxylum novogranatense TaxID=1862640 RepID=A0AAV8TSU7_9ROSI|nr:hypothetical protein K2173_000919 [Erythroxylum novogranatense]
MGCKPESIHKVGLLTSEECWSIISQIALVQGDRQKLESIGRRIANKCKGLPLTATTVGGLLSFKKSEKEWLRVLEKKEWEGEDILGPLKLSYYDLPLPLKQCFSYCAIFPKDSEIEKRRLIKMWMAQGFLKAKEDEDLEIVGETYFENLVARSLLQISLHKENIYVLHDMVSDLAHTVANDECLMTKVLNDTELSKNSLHARANARHLTLVIENDTVFPKYVYDQTKLRSLIIKFVGYRSILTTDVVNDIFNYLTCLRTLDLSKCGIKEVPSSIEKLVHLRWLDLSENNKLEKLPDTLCECYNLQTLILNWCQNLIELPQGIGKLINLMYLDIEDSCKIKYLPKGIGNLWRLRELTVFIINVNEGESFSIVEMEKLNNLGESLKLRGLGNVKRLEDAKKAQLKKKKNVTDLSLSFDGNHVQEDEEELLEALEPPLDLEILSIQEYEGKRLFPSWMMKLNLLSLLKLQNCSHCEELPPLGKLLCLKKLYLQNMGVKRVGVEFMGIEKEKDSSASFVSFPKLKVLQFWISWEWEEWDDVDEQLMEIITVMPCLQELTIFSCPKLKRLPSHLLSSTITRLQLLSIKYSDALQQEIQKYELAEIPHLEIIS